MSNPIYLLNQKVQIHCSVEECPASSGLGNEDNQSARTDLDCIYVGRITELDSHRIMVKCEWPDPFVLQVENLVEVTSCDETLTKFSFFSSVRDHYLDEQNKQQVFLLSVPKEVNRMEHREAQRSEFKQSGMMRIIHVRSGLPPLTMRNKTYPVVIRNVSETGVQVLTNIQVPDQVIVELSFTIAGESLAEQAEVVWARVVDEFFIYGMRFTNSSLFLRQLLRNMVSK